MGAFTHFDPGNLRKKIQIIKIGSSKPDEDGFDTAGSEEVVAECRAQVTNESGSRALESGSDFSVAKKRFLIRDPRRPVNTDMLIRYAGEDYSIVRPPNTYGDSREFIEIWTELKKRY